MKNEIKTTANTMSPIFCTAENCMTSFKCQEELEEHRLEHHGDQEKCQTAGGQRSEPIFAEEAVTYAPVDDAKEGKTP